MDSSRNPNPFCIIVPVALTLKDVEPSLEPGELPSRIAEQEFAQIFLEQRDALDLFFKQYILCAWDPGFSSAGIAHVCQCGGSVALPSPGERPACGSSPRPTYATSNIKADVKFGKIAL
jgi:hypothetical protein